jgi:kynurenine formamidase
MYETDEELLELYYQVSNKGRWGENDQIGTLNYITDEKRREASKLVTLGKAVSISNPVDENVSTKNPIPAVHYMFFEKVEPVSALDFIGMPVHTFSNTHLDSVAHVNWEGNIYNGRRYEDVITPRGITYGGIDHQRHGIYTRGVLLDICEVRGVEYLDISEYVHVDDLEKAEKIAGVRVESGDCIFVRVGLGLRETVEGPSDPFNKGVPGIHADVIPWLHKREVAVWSGDCYDKIPYPSKRFPLVMHMIGLASMGLVQLDMPDVELLHNICRELGRNEFLVTAAPLYIKCGTGSPINPVCIF